MVTFLLTYVAWILFYCGITGIVYDCYAFMTKVGDDPPWSKFVIPLWVSACLTGWYLLLF